MTDAVTLYRSLLREELEGAEALQATHQMLSLVMDSIPQAIFWKDRQSRYLGCNRVFAELAGFEPGELEGKSDLDLPWGDYEAPDYRDWDRHVMETGRPEFGIVEKLHRRDGTTLSIETNKVPLRGFGGEVVGVLGTFEDVTEKVRAEEDLQRSFEELDERVRLRTEELSRANEILRREVDERVRLQAEERQQRAYADALRETAAAISSSLDLDDVLEEVLVGAERLLSHDLGAVVLFDGPDADDMTLARHRARFGYGPDSDDWTGESPDLTVVARLRLAGSSPSVLTVGPAEPTTGLWPQARSIVVAPMAVGGQLIGMLVVESATSGLFDASHLERLCTVADQAAAAISNARLFERAAEMATVDERQRLARDLHDSVSQTLWSASLLAGALADHQFDDPEIASTVKQIKTLSRGAVAEMRTLLLELRPQALEQASLHELLEQLIAGLEGRKDLTVHADLADVSPVATDAKLAIYRIAQEALNNVSRHAEADTVTASLSRNERVLVMTISDNGRGLPSADSRSDRLGLSIMRERAADVGAELTLRSEPGLGTEVRLVVPIQGGGR